MKKPFSFILLLCFVVFCFTAKAQVNVDVRIDSMSIYVGEQTDVTLKVAYDSNKQLTMPDIKAGTMLMPNIEVIAVHTADTSSLNQGKRMQLEQKYTITAWDSALYSLPPFEVMVDTQVVESKSLALKVYSLQVDTTKVDKFFPANEYRRLPFSYDDWKDLVVWGILIIPLLAIGLFFFVFAANGKPIMRFIRRKKKLPPHQAAMNEISRIKAERKWAAEDSKEYYTELTDTLRTYIQERYGFSAMEMTSDQIIERLMEVSDESQLSELREIFRTADLVKFAKWNTFINENDANLVAAVEYINRTKQVEEVKKPEPEVIREMDKERLKQVVGFRVAGSIFFGGALAITVWIIIEVIDLLS